MSELVPKIADIATLKGISMLLALPMLCVAYTFQTGLEINIDGSIWFALETDDGEKLKIFKIITIFILKSLWISFFAGIFYKFVIWLHSRLDFPLLYIVSMLLIALALLGIFGEDKIPETKNINMFWYYSLIVWGIFLTTLREKLDKIT